MPYRYDANANGIAAATGRSEVDRHAECTHHLQLLWFFPVKTGGAEFKPGGEQFSEPNRSQQPYLTSIPRHKLCLYPQALV